MKKIISKILNKAARDAWENMKNQEISFDQFHSYKTAPEQYDYKQFMKLDNY
jgi:hypothetical protein